MHPLSHRALTWSRKVDERKPCPQLDLFEQLQRRAYHPQRHQLLAQLRAQGYSVSKGFRVLGFRV